MHKLYERVQKYCEECARCQQMKVPTQKFSEPGIIPIPRNPIDKLEIDIQGPYTKSKRGNCNIIIATDYLTRFIFAKVAKKVTSSTVIKFIENLMLEHGTPLTVQMDQGTIFTSSEFKQFLKNNKIRQQLSTPYHPQTQGQVERMNKTLNQRIRLSVNPNESLGWDLFVKRRYAIGNNQNRETCLDYLCCCDIIECNLQSDLSSLSLTPLDISKLGHKLDVGTTLNPRIDERIQFGLKYYAYLLLELTNFQRREHSPAIDALVTLWVYYYAMSKEKAGLKHGNGHPTMTSRIYIANFLADSIKEQRKWPHHYYQKSKTTPGRDQYPLSCNNHLNLT